MPAVHLQVRHTPKSCRRRSAILGSVEWGQMKMGPSRCKRPPGYYGGTGGREVGGERRVRGRGISLFSMLRMCYFILRSRLRKRRPSNALQCLKTCPIKVGAISFSLECQDTIFLRHVRACEVSSSTSVRRTHTKKTNY